MTFVLAARCRDGVVVAADRRVITRRTELDDEVSKIYQLSPALVIAFTGDSEAASRLVDRLQEKQSGQGDGWNLKMAVRDAEDALTELRSRYKESYEEVFKELEGVVVGLEEGASGKASLFRLGLGGYSKRESFLCLGSAGEPSHLLARSLWQPQWSADQSWALAVFFIRCAELLDISVGGVPDVCLVRDGTGVEWVGKERVEAIYRRCLAARDRVAPFILRRLKPS